MPVSVVPSITETQLFRFLNEKVGVCFFVDAGILISPETLIRHMISPTIQLEYLIKSDVVVVNT